MRDESSVSRRRRSVVLAALLVAGIAASVGMQLGGRLETAGRAVLALCVLLGGMRLTGAVRRALGAQRPDPLRAPVRSASRRDVLPVELGRIVAEIRNARRSAEHYGAGLGARFERLDERRGSLSPRAQETSLSELGSERAPGLEEIEAVVRRAERS